ncbi:MAG: ZIP family metal transporter [Candidatus Enteromonas sp.]|nr:ZIP family metal transporter [Candidatus Enteromonas sp.]
MTPIIASIISLSIVFAATTIGSACVFFFRHKLSVKMNNIILGFAGGIMIAASFFGLILPSISESKDHFDGPLATLIPIIGFLIGCLVLWAMDKFIPHLHKNTEVQEGVQASKLNEDFKFFLAVTIHNIPEGLAVGFACGLALSGNTPELMWAALSLAIGIAIQNIPEGAAVSIPLYSEGMNRGKAFVFGSMSGIVEPLFGLAGLFLAQLAIISPWLLAFAAGAMFYVILDELLPDSRKGGFEHYGLWAFIAGFLIMMSLELLL